MTPPGGSPSGGRHSTASPRLTDVVMPRRNGLELYERLRERNPELRVPFMSGYAASAVTEHASVFQVHRLLHKPSTSDALARQVRDVLDADATPAIAATSSRGN